MKRLLLCFAFVFPGPSNVSAEVLVLEPSDDVSMFEDAQSNASGQDPVLFVGNAGGVTGIASPRRALIRFDLSELPANAEIESVRMAFTIERAAPGSSAADAYKLHRATREWSEGPTGTPFPVGTGLPAAAGDVTWTHAVFPDTEWTTAGGDFEVEPSVTVNFPLFGSAAFVDEGLIGDVEFFLANPGQNFGWMLIGNEVNLGNARRLHSREAASVSDRPVLEIIYTVSTVPGVSDILFLY